jgi:hypothetical protein
MRNPTIISTPAFPYIPEDLRKKSLASTLNILKELDAMRRKLKLPADQLPLVIEIYGQQAAGLVAEKTREDVAARTKRLPLRIRSETKDHQPMKIVPSDEAIMVSARPQWCGFQPEDLSINGDRTRWIVDDIRIGNRSQLLGHAIPIPGAEFGPGGVCASLRLDTVQTAMDVQLWIRYIGPEAEGEVFEATFVGSAIEA